ncbi:MAG TPA: hypothetical protein VHV10_12960, partial [Ktedonobacteraceae bacterium]|nr:hypothetical protein [Ktedonobacteraceae bacterium]
QASKEDLISKRQWSLQMLNVTWLGSFQTFFFSFSHSHRKWQVTYKGEPRCGHYRDSLALPLTQTPR